MSDLIEKAKEQIEGTTLSVAFESVEAPGLIILKEPPTQRTITYRKYDNKYTLPMPWIMYAMEHYPQFNGGTWYMHTMYFAPQEPIPGLDVFYPTIPNFNKDIPCTAVFESHVNTSIPAMISSFWNEKFGRDGRLAYNAAWRKLAQHAGVTPGKRDEVLQYWETLDLNQYLLRSRPNVYPRRIS